MSERDARLDGLRGLATILVVVSHYLAEVRSGIPGLSLAFFAVVTFFVLSGFLIGRLIMERSSSGNFYRVFYARRFLRTLPSYALVLAAILAATAWSPVGWIPQLGEIPALSYATFTQNLYYSSRLAIGSEWLGPTWTLAVEEQFYLIAPLAIIWTPARFRLPVIAAVITASIAYRFHAALQGHPPLRYLPTLLGNADALAMGIGAAVLLRQMSLSRIADRLLEITPIACLLLILAATAFMPHDLPVVLVMRPLVAVAAAAFILRIALNKQVSNWLTASFLCRMGHNSYSIYLVHMPVAGIVHGLITGLHPDIGSAWQIVATALAFPATVLVAMALTKAVEEPATRLGRRFRWRPAAGQPDTAQETVPPQPQPASVAPVGAAT